MDELAFKRHLRDLAHGHHHPEEHDWGSAPAAGKTKTTPRGGRAKASQPKSKASKKRRPH
jgi:hypothetical protein